MEDTLISMIVNIEQLRRQNGYCDCCGKPLFPVHGDGENSVFHRKQLRGTSTIRNVVVLCPSCHAKIHEYMEKYPRRGYKYHKECWVNSDEFKKNNL